MGTWVMIALFLLLLFLGLGLRRAN
jgi:hypothetical protein